MKRCKKVFLYIFAILAVFFISNFINNNLVLAGATQITSITLNGLSQNVKFNPQNGDKVVVNIDLSNIVKITRVYVCTLDQVCNGTKGNYTRYFSPSATTSSVSESWDGKVSTASDAVFAPAGEYRVMISFYENGASTATNVFGQYTISSDFSYNNSSGGGGAGDTGDTSGGDDTGTPPASSTDSVDSSETVNNSSSSLHAYSVHYIQEDVSDYTEPTSFQVSAGRPRLSYVNSPVDYIAKHKTSKNLANNSCHYEWSFGDGTAKSGEKVEHIYKYPGDYNIVLNGSCIDLESVSRTTIKILQPNLSISHKADGSVEVFNHGQSEINLYGFKLQAGNQYYAFPLDTIVSAGKKVVFPFEYLKISNLGSITLLDASNQILAQAGTRPLAINGGNTVSAVEVEKFTTEYKRLTQVSGPVANQLNQNNISLTASVAGAFISASTTSSSDQEEEISSEVSVQNPPRGFWSKLFHPIRTIKEAFYQ